MINIWISLRSIIAFLSAVSFLGYFFISSKIDIFKFFFFKMGHLTENERVSKMSTKEEKFNFHKYCTEIEEVYSTAAALAGCDSRSFLKRSLISLKSSFSFS